MGDWVSEVIGLLNNWIIG